MEEATPIAVIDDPEAGVETELEPVAEPDAEGADEWAKDQELRRYDEATRELIDEMEQEVREDEQAWNHAKARAAELKKVYERKVVELRQLIQRRRENRGKPPEKTLFTGVEGEIVDAEFEYSVPAADPLESLWRDYPLDRWTAFGLSEKQIEKLQAAGLSTVGELADYSQPNGSGYCKKFTDIKGVGKALAEKIEEANLGFWAEWNRVLKDKFAEEKGVVAVGTPQPEESCNVEDHGDQPGDSVRGGSAAPAPDGDQPGDDAGPREEAA